MKPSSPASESSIEVNNVTDSSISCSHYVDDFGAFERTSKVTKARESESMQVVATSHHSNNRDCRSSPKQGENFRGRTKSSLPC